MRRARAMSFGIIVMRLAWIAHRFVSSNKEDRCHNFKKMPLEKPIPALLDVDVESEDVAELHGWSKYTLVIDDDDKSVYVTYATANEPRRTLAMTGVNGITSVSLSIARVLKNGSIVRKQHNIPLHSLVLWLCIGPRPSPAHTVRHMDGDRFNNAPGNLLWVTVSQQQLNRRIAECVQPKRFVGIEPGDEFVAELRPGNRSFPELAEFQPKFTKNGWVVRWTKLGRAKTKSWYATKPKPNKFGYPYISFAQHTYLVHVLVWAAVHHDQPLPEAIDHRDGDRYNWMPDNLVGVTRSENGAAAAYFQEATSKGKKAPRAVAMYEVEDEARVLVGVAQSHHDAGLWAQHQLAESTPHLQLVNFSGAVTQAIAKNGTVRKRFAFSAIPADAVASDRTHVWLEDKRWAFWIPEKRRALHEARAKLNPATWVRSAAEEASNAAKRMRADFEHNEEERGA